MIAQYGDAFNFSLHGNDVLQHKLDVLREHCATLNRPYEQIEKPRWS